MASARRNSGSASASFDSRNNCVPSALYASAVAAPPAPCRRRSIASAMVIRLRVPSLIEFGNRIAEPQIRAGDGLFVCGGAVLRFVQRALVQLDGFRVVAVDIGVRSKRQKGFQMRV